LTGGRVARAAELPVNRIVLFTSGVGYFEREGQVDGNVRVDLQFHTRSINDLLKSLVLQDKGGGRISTVSYDNRDPIDKTLKSFGIDLTQNPGLGQLLEQVRGERVEIISYGEPGNQGRPTTLTGDIVGVQKLKKPAGKDQVIESEQLNLLTSEGLQGVALDQVQRVRFLKPELETEFRKALAVLAAGHDKQKKMVSLNFLGNGKRPVRVGYVVESPIWKTSYRLALDKEQKTTKAFLQGWAIVENTTDEDWNQVRLGLVAGRPISFQMDLYEPLYVPRPVVEPELFASLRPQAYTADLNGTNAGRGEAALRRFTVSGRGNQKDLSGLEGQIREATRKEEEALARYKTQLQLNSPGRGASSDEDVRRAKLEYERAHAEAMAARRSAVTGLTPGAFSSEDLNMAAGQGVASAAIATELGEYFKYEIEQPVSLARQKSSLIPIVNGPVEASRVSIYNDQVHAKFPLLGLRFKNTTGLHLMQGPVTVFEGNTYAGDARVADVQPNETRPVSYAVDLGTEVAPEVPNPADNIVAVKIYKGIIHTTHKVRHQKNYTIKNRSEHERLVLVEHPYQPGMTLVAPGKAAERTRDLYRFEVKAEPNKPVKLEVIEDQQRVDQTELTNLDNDNVLLYIRMRATSPKVKEALEQALKLKSELASTQKEITREEQDLEKIEKDQARMRENMKAMPPTSDAYRRYLKKFDTQETDIEQRRDKLAKLQETAERQKKAYESFVANLNVE
jgi:hypothetical protein